MIITNVPSEYDWSTKTILIGEDEVINFRLLEVMLSKTKVSILHGNTGSETLSLYQKNPQIDLILMDIKMPEMDGCEVTKEIRKHNTTIPIIAQTAYALDEERTRTIEAGCNTYITKPIIKKNLLQLIESFFKTK